jgi:hypothetical protein
MTALRTCVVCDLPRIDPATDRDTRVCRDCELARQSAETPFSEGAGDAERARIFIAESGWRLARTMLHIPHQYTVRDLSSRGADKTTARNHSSFEWFVEYVREHGTQKRWGPYNNTYLVIDGWEYWTMGFPVAETTIVNRQAAGPGTTALIEAEVAEALGVAERISGLG